ncbi:MAG: hypothetical protein KGI60_04645, partial [Patescibacteria group bacterium]|nr:hypothetical protein [Patescibacteria group bacterium]
GDVTTSHAKTLGGLLLSPFNFLTPIAYSEPLLIILALIGLLAFFKKRRGVFYALASFIYIYSGLFYLAFRYEHRFTAGLLPILAIMAAYGLTFLVDLSQKRWLYAMLAIPLAFSLRLALVISHNDSRIAAIDWIEHNIPAHEKILVFARMTRLPTEPDAIAEQNAIDSGSLRQVDASESVLPQEALSTPTFHALNLYSVNNEAFFASIATYAKDHHYAYALVSDEDFLFGDPAFAQVQNFIATQEVVRKFGSVHPAYSISNSQLWGSPLALFDFNNFGPGLTLYKLNN